MDPDGNYESRHSTRSCDIKVDRLGEDPVEVISKLTEAEEFGKEGKGKHAHDYDHASAPPLEETPTPGTRKPSSPSDRENLSPPEEPVPAPNSVAMTIRPADELPVALPIVTSTTVGVDASLSESGSLEHRRAADKGPENGQEFWSTRKIALACLALTCIVVGGLAASITILLKPDKDPVMTLHTFYPDCHVPMPTLVGNGNCDGLPYNTAICGWDGGDCLVTKGATESDDAKESEDNSMHNTTDVDVGKSEVDEEEEEEKEKEEDQDLDAEISAESKPNDPKDTLTSTYPVCAGKVPDISKLGDGTCDGFRYNIEECGWDGGDCLVVGYANCHVDHPEKIGNGECNAFGYNTEQCGWDGGDCIEFNGKYPNCDVDYPRWIGDGQCHPRYNTEVCGWDGGDCFMAEYPECKVSDVSKIGDGRCDRYGQYNTAVCGWDGGDCLKVDWPGCQVVDPMSLQGLGNGVCNGSLDIIECGFDLGDCKADLDLAELKDHVEKYPNCYFDDIDLSWIGDGDCDEDQYDTAECEWDGGDCLVTGYPNCHGVYPEYVGDGDCDKESNKASCGWDGGDCLQFNRKYPNCDVEAPYYVGDGDCDGGNYNTAECGWDGGDCEDNDEAICDCSTVNCPNGEKCDPLSCMCFAEELLAPCVAVIDEDDDFSCNNWNGNTPCTQEDLWDLFRQEYSRRPFCLLVPADEASNPIALPDNFLNDPNKVIKYGIDRNGGIEDWVSYCELNEYTSNNARFIVLFVDNSGSMFRSTVRNSIDQLYDDCRDQGMEVNEVYNVDENWILPFLTSLKPEEQ